MSYASETTGEVWKLTDDQKVRCLEWLCGYAPENARRAVAAIRMQDARGTGDDSPSDVGQYEVCWRCGQ